MKSSAKKLDIKQLNAKKSAAKANRKILFVLTGAVLVLMAGCAKEEDVEPKFTSLWDNVFSGCGTSCHSASATDGTEDGPDLSTKSSFYNNLFQRSVSTNYSQWIKTGNCDNVNFIAPNDASQSTLAAALVLSVSNSLGATCDTTYNVHTVNNSVITDSNAADALIEWINDGAENN